MINNMVKQLPVGPTLLRKLTCVFVVNYVVIAASYASAMVVPQVQAQTVVGRSVQSPANSMAVRSGATAIAPDDISSIKLMPGSMVQLHVLEESDLDGSYRLDQRGDVSLPLIGSVNLQSLTLQESEVVIREKLISTKILKVANVEINLSEYSALKITVLGEVAAPGSFAVLGPHKLQDILALAGGETPLADRKIEIQRLGSPPDTTESIQYNRNGTDASPLSVMINPGDTVLVKKAGIVYILGAVTRPGGYLLQEAGELNLDQALAMALGTSIEAKIQDLRVFRKLPDGTELEIHANYKKINSGKQAPIFLKAQDVVYVPPSSLKTIFIRGGTTVLNAAAQATVYAAY